jgi:hypothetical protein
VEGDPVLADDVGGDRPEGRVVEVSRGDVVRDRAVVEGVLAPVGPVDELVAGDEVAGRDVLLERAGCAGTDDRLDPERAQGPDVRPVVDGVGGIEWRRPWRGRKAIDRPWTSARKTLSDGGPYGVSTLISRTSSSSE